MLLNTWDGDTTFARPHTHVGRWDRGGGAKGAFDLAAATRFYGELLGGRQVWRTGVAESRRTLWFMVDHQVIAVPVGKHSERRRTMIEVDDPAEVAERCWDAGFDVYVGDPDTGDQLVVVDPFDNHVELVAAAWAR